jgi:arabinogalactan oligomer/maltooligosaccharide transport system substrate-binding protein
MQVRNVFTLMNRKFAPTSGKMSGRLLFALIDALFLATLGAISVSANAQTETLTLWEHEHPEVQTVLDKLVAEFEAQNPTVKVKRTHYKTEDLRTQFQTAAMGGGGGDLVLGPNDFGGPFSVMGIVQPVGEWADTGRFTQDVVKAVSDASGKVWGFPVSRGNHLMLFVNTKLVPTPPETIEDLIAVAQKLTDAKQKKYGFAYNLTEPFFFVPFMGAFGAVPMQNGKPNLGGDGMIQALDLVKDLKFKEKIVPEDCDYACAETLFLEGKAGMLINGDWAVPKYRESLGDSLAIAPLPKSAKTGQYMAPMISGKFLFFNKKLAGKRLDAAKAFAEYLAKPATQERMIRELQRLPVLTALEKSPALEGDKVLKATNAAMSHGQPMPMDVELRAVWDAIRPQLQAVMAGRAESKTAAQLMQKDAEIKIKEMKQ